ncbi:MAG TPA: DUF2752 domain-containing protein [Gemmataceae bacterium]|nr:DUF2752 domain-containing protein [Gemmataceae bacterium]
MSRGVGDHSSWLRQFLNDTFLRACAVFAVVCVLMPSGGLGVELCPCLRMTHAPCPGCGVTRCGSCLARGEVRRAFRYHPLGTVVFPLSAGLGLLALVPRRWRHPACSRLAAWGAPLRPLYLTAAAGFVTFGVVRFGLVLAGWTEFPATWP